MIELLNNSTQSTTIKVRSAKFALTNKLKSAVDLNFSVEAKEGEPDNRVLRLTKPPARSS